MIHHALIFDVWDILKWEFWITGVNNLKTTWGNAHSIVMFLPCGQCLVSWGVTKSSSSCWRWHPKFTPCSCTMSILQLGSTPGVPALGSLVEPLPPGTAGSLAKGKEALSGWLLWQLSPAARGHKWTLLPVHWLTPVTWLHPPTTHRKWSPSVVWRDDSHSLYLRLLSW